MNNLEFSSVIRQNPKRMIYDSQALYDRIPKGILSYNVVGEAKASLHNVIDPVYFAIARKQAYGNVLNKAGSKRLRVVEALSVCMR